MSKFPSHRRLLQSCREPSYTPLRSSHVEADHKYSFVPAKAFTNALLHPHDITALIRDTEAHERALFTAGPLSQSKNAPRRSTVHGSGNNSHVIFNDTGLTGGTGYGSAVAKVLGPVLGGTTTKDRSNDGRGGGEIDVDVLLKGAEKLCKV